MFLILFVVDFPMPLKKLPATLPALPKPATKTSLILDPIPFKPEKTLDILEVLLVAESTLFFKRSILDSNASTFELA